MPVRFACSRCHTRLSVGRRKIGTSTECPKCGHPLIVPSESDAEMSLVLSGIAKSDPATPNVEAIPEFIVFDDVPGLVQAQAAESGDESATIQQVPPSAHPPADLPSIERPAKSARTSSRQSSMLLVSRSVLFFQAALILVVALTAFLAGYLAGRGDGQPADSMTATEVSDPVVVEGKIVYSTPMGTVTGDAGAVIVALPVNTVPPVVINTFGLRTRDPEPDSDHPGVAAINRLGGAYLRSDEQGAFSLVVPRPGQYYVLLISAKTGRPSSMRPDRSDLAMLVSYFSRPSELLDSRKYHLDQWVLDGETTPISHDFGRHLQ